MPRAAGRPEQPLDITAGPLTRLAGELRQLRGPLSNSALAQKARVSVGTLSAATKGEQLPTWSTVKAVAAACGDDGTVRAMRELWKDACAAEGRPVPDDPPDDPPVPEPGSVTDTAQFITMMRQLLAWAGLSYSKLNGETRKHNELPRSTVSDVLRGQRLPRLEFVLAYVRACGLDDEQAAAWEQAWAALRERELSPASQQPPAEALPQRPPWTARALARLDTAQTASRHFLVWLSGARPELLKHSRTDRLAYTGLGGVILISGITAALSAAFGFHTAFYVAWLPAALLGAAFGAGFMTVDRLIVFSIRRGAYQKILLTITPRLMLAALFAVIFATPVLMRAFAPEITAQITQINQARAEQSSTGLSQSSLGTQINSLQSQLNHEQQLSSDYYHQWQCQLYGGPGCHKGSGPLAEAARNNYYTATATARSLSTQLSQARAELTQLQSRSSNVIIHGTPGLLERLDALDQIASQSTVLAVTRALVILFFIVLGCLPVLARTIQVLGPQGAYETILKIQERADIQTASQHIRNYSSPATTREPGRSASRFHPRRQVPSRHTFVDPKDR
jgi:hypothetical protein